MARLLPFVAKQAAGAKDVSDRLHRRLRLSRPVGAQQVEVPARCERLLGDHRCDARGDGANEVAVERLLEIADLPAKLRGDLPGSVGVRIEAHAGAVFRSVRTRPRVRCKASRADCRFSKHWPRPTAASRSPSSRKERSSPHRQRIGCSRRWSAWATCIRLATWGSGTSGCKHSPWVAHFSRIATSWPKATRTCDD